MKKISILGVALAFLGTGVATTSCEDMLTFDMENHADASASVTDTVYYFHGILKCLQDIGERTVILGEARGDLASPGTYVSDSINEIATFQSTANGSNGLLDRAAYYKVINQCNFYLAHVDTMSVMNNTYYMRKEYAQVQMIRAWTYMQLVQYYGSVPFITEPVDNANTGWENTATKATRSNLLDLLLAAGLQQSYEWSVQYGLPSYGDYSIYDESSTTVSSQRCMFPADLVMGDLYLFCAQDSLDYVQAATYYYNYITDNDIEIDESRVAQYTVQNRHMNNESYQSDVSSWVDVFESYTLSSGVITMIPSSAVSTMGTVMTDVQEIFGFELSASQSATVNEDDEDEVDISGDITPTASDEYRQLIPSEAYLQLNSAQNYAGANTSGSSEAQLEYYDCGDARLDGSAPMVAVSNTSGGTTRGRFIHKFCPASNINNNNSSGFTFHYGVTLYRTTLVYLRYAEALNRAGFPEHAYAILSHGLGSSTIPTLITDTDDLGDVTYSVDSTLLEGRAHISIDELRRAQQATEFLNVAMMPSTDPIGIHSLGCGGSPLDVEDTLYSYTVAVPQRIAEEQARTGANFENDTEAYQNAVEDLIVDELALEMAFEGNRFGDLQRIAAHKNNVKSGYGTEWLAWKIARRGVEAAPYEDTTNYDTDLYTRLLTESNWYLQNPE